jgi:hypothetical protein
LKATVEHFGGIVQLKFFKQVLGQGREGLGRGDRRFKVCATDIRVKEEGRHIVPKAFGIVSPDVLGNQYVAPSGKGSLGREQETRRKGKVEALGGKMLLYAATLFRLFNLLEVE